MAKAGGPDGPVTSWWTYLQRPQHPLQSEYPLRPTRSNSLDDEAFQPGALYVNQALMEELHRGHSDWSITDVHGGIYLLGTRFRASQS